MLDAQGRVPEPVVVPELSLVDRIRAVFVEADMSGRARLGRNALATLLGASRRQTDKALAEIAAESAPPVATGELAAVRFRGNPKSDRSNGLSPVGDTQSPFDAVRRVRADGSEYWAGRELMPLMQYSQWHDFAAVIEKARAALILIQGTQSAGGHFAQMRKVTEGGRWGTQSVDDFRLTKFGAHLVAMAGDDTKAAVAEARVYFAVQTDRAERELAPVIAPIAPAVPATVGGLAPVLYAMVDAYAQLEQRMDIMEQGQQRQAAVIERVDRWLTSGDTVYVEEWAKTVPDLG